jgi:hypothetical protein
MHRIALFIVAAGLSFLAPTPAHAQATRTWVSGVGDDMAMVCSRTQPCKTFAGAISVTAAGGEINCTDGGGFGSVTITKAITINCEGMIAGVLAGSSGQHGIVINAATTDQVVLKGLDIEGVGVAANGIRFLQGASLLVQDCVIRGFGIGIAFLPSNTARLAVVDTVLQNNGDATANNGGIQISPGGSSAARAVMDNVRVFNGTSGIVAIGLVSARVFNSNVSLNSSNGLVGLNGGTIRVGRSVISSNAGLATFGSVLSYLDNDINNNGTDTFPASAGGYR